MAAQKRITIIGSANTDFIMKLPALPKLGETVGEGVFLQAFGGKGANQAVAAARAGGNVEFIGGLGADTLGQQTLANLQADGIDISLCVTTPNHATGTALILVDAQGNNSIAVAPGANFALTPDDIETCADVIRDSALIVIQMEIPAATVRRVLEIAEQHATPVLFNFAPARTKDLSVTSAMTILVVNELEAEALTGFTVSDITQAESAARNLLAHGSQSVIVTLGAQGSVAASHTDCFHVLAFDVTPVDSTAAGDVFCGALATALVEAKSLPDAVLFATAAASLSVTRMGAQPSIPIRAEIEAFLLSQKKQDTVIL